MKFFLALAFIGMTLLAAEPLVIWFDKENPNKDASSKYGGGKPDGAKYGGGKPEGAQRSSGKPEGEKHGGEGGMHGGRPTGLKLWLLNGDFTQAKNCCSNTQGTLEVYDNALQSVTAKVVSKRDQSIVSADAKEPGRYTLYYTVETLEGNTRYVNSAKYDTVYARHGDKVELRSTNAPQLPFEIVRIQGDDEKLFSRFASGDMLNFQVLLNNKPLAGANVTFETKGGWSKRLKSDKNGRVSFTIIKEYFPPWSLFEKRHKDDFLITASYTKEETGALSEGNYTQTHYSMTYPDSFYPEASSYRSYAYALSFGTLALLLTSIFIYLYRRRREKPFTEVRFDEKN